MRLAKSIAGLAFLISVSTVWMTGCDGVDLGDFDDDPVVANPDDDGDDSDGDAPTASGKVYYVSPDGDDDASGLTESTSFQTLARAATALSAGDTIVLTTGVYAADVLIEGVGRSDAVTTIRGQGSGVVLDGQGSGTSAIYCDDCVNFTIEGLEVRNYTDAGIIVTLSSDITLRDLIVHNNGAAATLEWSEGYGLHVDDSSGVLIEDNECYANGPSPQIPGRLMGTGINTFGNTDVIIRNNISRDNIGGGMLVEDSVGVLVENNVITGNDLDASAEDWWDGGLWVDGGSDVTVRNNTFANNLGPALEISNEDNQEISGYVIENNIISNNYYGFYIWNFGSDDLPPESILRLSGNEITGSTIQDFWIQALPCPPDDPCD